MKNKRKRNLAVSLLLILVFSMTGTMMAFAYEPPTQMDIGDEKFSLDIQIGDEPMKLEVEEMPYDFFFIDDNEEIQPLYDGEITPYCTHVFSSEREISIHNKYNNGSCDVIKRQGEVCEKCKYVKFVGEDMKMTHYGKCPH